MTTTGAQMMTTTTLTPTYYIPHGGGPWPFMPESAASLESLTAFLRGLIASSGTKPRAIVVISAHWEEPIPTVSSRADHSMLFDYRGFPEHTYALDYPAPGSPSVAKDVVAALSNAGFASATEDKRGYDHGVFVPFMLVDPDGTIPVIPVSFADILHSTLRAQKSTTRRWRLQLSNMSGEWGKAHFASTRR